MAVPTLLYGCESWVLTQKTLTTIQSSEMKFLRRINGCTREDRIRNEEIRKELQVTSINTRMQEYRQRWVEHVERMSDSRLPKAALLYAPRGRRDVGRPRKRWRETVRTEQAVA
ncbi:hypothetical protein R5R35_014440 [Gryllus longicercus]|uniref:Endonuclease-reverse transcriptase n=1 Tax=Gryllus longicercus TaxID=2509291 RepID=A0AAN9V0X3_9ORTH